MAALYAAVKQYLDIDYGKYQERAEREVQAVIDAFLGSKVFKVSRDFPNESGQPCCESFFGSDF